jgi:RHS repeat-associated protein
MNQPRLHPAPALRVFSPFGVGLEGRTYTSESGYRYGFNGKEKDDEGMGGGGQTYDYGFRIYNPGLAKFLSVEPLSASYPWYTPYQFAGNKPIACIDIEGLEELWVVARSFIPAPKLSNPDPLSSTVYPYYLGDDRTSYRSDAGKSFRTEQYVFLNFNNQTTAKNQFASPSTAVGSDDRYIASSDGSSDAGSIDATIQGKCAMVNFIINATNELAATRNPFTPAINAKIDVSITPLEDGSFDYSVKIPEMDGFPAYELWINDDQGNSFLLFGRNPNESGETPLALFGSGEHQYKLSGNSKDLVSKPVQTFDEYSNPQECSDDCSDECQD